MGYKIQTGDNLTKIARTHGTTVQELLRHNPKYAKNPDLIYAGDTLNMPQRVKTPSKQAAARLPKNFADIISPAQAPQYKPGAIDDIIANAESGSAAAMLDSLVQRLLDISPDSGAIPTPESQALQPASSPLEYLMGTGLMTAAMPKALTALAAKAPAVYPSTVSQFPAVTRFGHIVSPAARGFVPHAGAKPAMGNVRPMPGDPVAQAAMMRNNSPEALMSQALRNLRDVPSDRIDPDILSAILRGGR